LREFAYPLARVVFARPPAVVIKPADPWGVELVGHIRRDGACRVSPIAGVVRLHPQKMDCQVKPRNDGLELTTRWQTAPIRRVHVLRPHAQADEPRRIVIGKVLALLKNDAEWRGPPGPAGPPGEQGPPGKLPMVKPWVPESVFYAGDVVA
jgi:hypothetical protein